MISHQHACIFIHIPKTAGTSVEKKLGHFQEVGPEVQDHRSIRELESFHPRHLGSIFRREDRHLLKRWRDICKGEPVPTRDQYHRYFKFTFVRNTWARVFSWYRNVMTNEGFLKDRGITSDLTLKEFLVQHPGEWGHRSQLYWIRDSGGRIPMDFIGRFERLAADFTLVGEKLGLGDCSLPRLIVGEGKKYTDFYDQETIDLVASRYAEEIEIFGFEYGE